MRPCRKRALRRADWSRFVLHASSPRQQDGPIPLCTAALRRASQGLKQEAGLRMCAKTNATARSLSREEA